MRQAATIPKWKWARVGGAWAICACTLALASPACAAAPAQYGNPQSRYARAERLREALEGRPERDRIHLDYERVLDAYRAIYHNDPASPRAVDSIAAVADLLAEEGRVFHDEKALHDAIGQYEFLRREYPTSRFRYSALLTEGEIYQRDLGDLEQAKKIYNAFLKMYPEHPLAVEARAQLKTIRHDEWALKHHRPLSTIARSAPAPVQNWRAAPVRSENELDAEQARAAAARTNNAPNAVTSSAAPARTAQPRIPAATSTWDSHATTAATSSPARGTPAPQPASLHVAPPMRSGVPLVTGIRHWSTPVYTRVAIDLQQQVRYTATRIPNPDRILFDLYGAKLSPELVGRSVEVTGDDFLTRVRVLQFSGDRVRVALDVNSLSDYSAFFLSNPSRLIIDVHGRRGGAPVEQTRVEPPRQTVSAGIGLGPVNAQPPAGTSTFNQPAPQPTSNGTIRAGMFPDANGRVQAPTALSEVAKLNKTPDAVKATRHPTTAPVVASVSESNRGKPSAAWPRPSASIPAPRTTAPTRTVNADDDDDVPPAAAGAPGVTAPAPAHAPSTMMRALGLKINRIVIDAGHGGHDSGTLGPGGLQEKDVVLDVALRLGKLLRQRLGAEVTYTRSDDTFIPLETRTAIANQAQADLFISVHANSSPDTTARGVEVYYLNFTSSADALEVAARENASSDESIHQLSDLVKKIALQDKINESRAFAADVDESLYSGLEPGNPGLRDRGVKKAPFVVLIGANMPSILAEISFLTNPDDAQELRQPRYRERIAESLYRGVAHYVESINGVRVARAGN